MTRYNFEPSEEELRTWGTLAYVDKAERDRILWLPSGQFKPAVKKLEKGLKAAMKRKGQP